MKVHNINGTSDNVCKCGTWKSHWEEYNEKGDVWPTYCSEVSCVERAAHGAHVQKEIGSDKQWYIIPLCTRHNGPEFHGKSIDVSDLTSFAQANRSETCGQ